jgi:hypothetical protein
VLSGTASVAELARDPARLDDFDTEPLVLGDVEIFQATFEMRVGGRQASLPAGLHPTNPPTCVFQVWRAADTPWGPLAVAQARVASRSGLRPRGFVQGCVVTSGAAAEALRRRFGFPARVGEVTLRRHYDGTEVSVVLDGADVLRITGADPEPLAPGDVAYSSAVTLADTPRGLRLVQVDVDATLERAERLRPRLDAFRAEPWMHPSVAPYHPVSASIAVGGLTLPRLRFVSRPDELAFTGTEPVGPTEGS